MVPGVRQRTTRTKTLRLWSLPEEGTATTTKVSHAGWQVHESGLDGSRLWVGHAGCSIANKIMRFAGAGAAR